MEPIENIYPNAVSEYGFYGVYDYEPLLRSIGTVALLESDDGYQGDSWVLYDMGSGRFGFISFGWGSCSGCDALQACSSYSEVAALRSGLVGQMFDGTAAEVMAHIDAAADAGRWYAENQTFERFRAKAREILAVPS